MEIEEDYIELTSKDYVTFRVAKALAEKGYVRPLTVDGYRYGDDGYRYWFSGIGAYEMVDKPDVMDRYQRPIVSYPCPTLWEAQKWLRERYKIGICPNPYDFTWGYTIYKLREIIEETSEHKFLSLVSGGFKSYEEALNNGIESALLLM